MRKTFVGHIKNQSDRYGICWRWTTCIIDFREHNSEEFREAFRYAGLPDDEEHKWKNGYYSCQYNEALNTLLSLGLIEITYDELDESEEVVE